MKKLLLVLFISTTAQAADFGYNAGKALEGFQQAQCRQDCQGDLQCIQNCSAYSQPEPQYQPRQRPVQHDYTCISRCTQAGYVYQLCQKNCEY